MRYKELMELFDTKVGWNWQEQSSDDWQGGFKLNGVRYDVAIGKFSNTEWEVAFDANGDMKITGASKDDPGNVLAVFATVAQMVSDFMSRAKPAILQFSASNSEPSRVRLYQRMSKQLANASGYDLKSEVKYGDTFFILSQKTQTPT